MEDRRSLPPHEDELSLALLRSAEHDEPSKAAYAKVATALGVGAAVGLGASLSVPATLASSGLQASFAARWWASLLVKVLVVGVSGLLLVAGGLALLRRQGAAASPTAHVTNLAAASVAFRRSAGLHAGDSTAARARPESEPALPVLARGTASGDARAVSVAPALAAGPAGFTPRASRATKSALARSAAAAQSVATAQSARVSSLPQQVLSLDRARVALNSGDATAALMEIAYYRGTWPKGVFLTEASVLEIEALAKRGETVLAGMRAQAFVAAHPDSPQAERLRALIPDGTR